jgi:uncharacterized protein (TIGR02231 family)
MHSTHIPAMNKIPLLLTALAFAIGAHAASTPDGSGRGVTSAISAVTVYPDRAVVTRTATLDLVPGTQEIVFANLPAALVDQSLQVSGRGSATATILDVSARQSYVNFTPNERVKALEDELRGLQKQFRALDDRAGTLNEQRDFVKRMLTASTGQIIYPLGAAPGTGGGTAARPSLDEWQKLYAYSEETFGKVAADLQSIDSQREELNALKAAREKQLNGLRGAGGRGYKTVTVRVAAANAGSLQLALAYTVPGASWTPAYDARLHSAERAVELTYFGLVRQNTGEDWKNVDLTLSTARPSLGGSPPALARWTVDVAQIVKLNPFQVDQSKDIGYYAQNTLAGSRLRTNVGDLASSITVATKQQLQDTAALNINDALLYEAGLESQVTSASFKILVAATILSDNSPQKVPVTSARFDSVSEYLAIPKQLPAAFLTAKVANASDFPLITGPMNVFLDGTFVATSALHTVMPGEKFDLALGADEGIAIKRRLNNRFTEDTGLVNRGQRITYDFTVTVQNNKPTAEKIVVQDQLPVSRNEKIVVKLLGADDKQVRPDPDGTLKWTLALKPGEKREVPLKFSVEYPNELIVAGLE